MFTITVPLTVVLMSVLGGTRHWAGPAVGAVAITGAALRLHRRPTTRSPARRLIGAILIAAILFMPRRHPGAGCGASGAVRRRRRRAPPRRARSRSAAARSPRAASGAGGSARRRRCCACAACASPSAACGRSPASTSTCGAARSSACSGPNGSGKSTFINVVSGHYAPSGGEVVLRGPRARRPAGAPHRARRHRAHLPDPAAVRAPERARQRGAGGDVRRRACATRRGRARRR